MSILNRKNKSKLITEELLRSTIQKDKKTKLIDVRTPAEYRPEHLNPCNNIDVRDNFQDKIKYFDKNNHYVLYCRNGRRSARAMKIMTKMGFENVKILDGGLSKWIGPLKLK